MKKDELYLVKIRPGSMIFHDMAVCTWPECKPPRSEYSGTVKEFRFVTKYPDALFIAKKKGDNWECWRDGYGTMASTGTKGKYGNGRIYVYGTASVVIIGKNYNEH